MKTMRDRVSTNAFPLLLPLLLLLAGCGLAATGQPEAPTPTPLPTPAIAARPRYQVERGTVVESLQAVGRVTARREQNLFFRRDGFVSQVAGAAGDPVEAGQILAELDVVELQSELARARLSLKRAQTVLALAETDREDALAEAQLKVEQAETAVQQAQVGAGDGGVTAAEVGVTRAEEALAFWQREYEKSLERDWEPQEERERYARELRNAEQNLTVARAQYQNAASRRSTDYYNVQLNQVDLDMAQLELEQLERGIDPLLALDVEQAQLNLDELEARLQDARLVAPFNGQLLRLNVRPGDAVAAYDSVALLADPAETEVTLEVGSDQLGRLAVGMTATLRLRSHPGEILTGTVSQIPGPLGSGVDDDRRVHVTLPQSEGVEIGDLATVTIVLEERRDTLWLPPAAIRSFQGRDFVVVETEDGQRRTDVRLGIGGDDRVQIIEGVSQGETVVGE